MALEKLFDGDEELGKYVCFDPERPNLIVYSVDGSKVRVAANHRILGILWEKVPSKFHPSILETVPVEDGMFQLIELYDKDGSPVCSSENDDMFFGTDQFFSALGTFAAQRNANIIDSNYNPMAVYEVHEVNRLVRLFTSNGKVQ